MSVTAPARSNSDRTLLHALVQERHLTREQMIDVLDRRAHEMGIKDFALSLRQVDRWFAGRVATAPRPSVCRVIEAEFGYPVDELLAPDARPDFRRAPLPAASNRDLRTVEFLSWIADHSGSSFEVLYAAVSAFADGLAAEPFATRAAKQHARARIDRARIAEALESYYGPGSGFYRATITGRTPMTLGVLTDARWLDLAVPMDSHHERFLLDYTSQPPPIELTAAATEAAIARLASIEVGDTVLLDNPLYRLLNVDVDQTHLSAALGLSSFASYALTADLLEAELLDAVADTVPGDEMRLPLRDLYLPSVVSHY